MKVSKITLEDLVIRLTGCRALLYALKESAENSDVSAEALDALGVLLGIPINTLTDMLHEEDAT